MPMTAGSCGSTLQVRACYRVPVRVSRRPGCCADQPGVVHQDLDRPQGADSAAAMAASTWPPSATSQRSLAPARRARRRRPRACSARGHDRHRGAGLVKRARSRADARVLPVTKATLPVRSIRRQGLTRGTSPTSSAVPSVTRSPGHDPLEQPDSALPGPISGTSLRAPTCGRPHAGHPAPGAVS
jgi:hypothetical protein